MKQNTLSYAQLLDLDIPTLIELATDFLDFHLDVDIELLLDQEVLQDEDIECIAEYIERCQNFMPN